ncbi:DMT family transporter [Deinococcus sp. KSM4-11]|uniref:DMT family transporter n=1 Tax=Deinococcus sp. KSM4-11 TaxID=2568654 RepID=UPI001F0F2752|nr:DMT family transporter [Deinococcus sp. KSM4-11]
MLNPTLSGLLSAATYGLGDFLSGLASRRDPPLRVVALTHPLSAVAMLLLAWGLGQPLPAVAELLWGAAAGLAGLIAVLAFYRALALGPMGVVSVGAGALSALVPVVVGVFGGEVLGVWGWLGAVGILAGTALLGWPAAGETSGRGVPLGLLAGVGFGVFFVLLAQAQGGGVFWVLGAARVASSLVAVPLAAATVGLRPRGPGLILASAPGDTLGNVFYLLAVQGGPLAVGALLTSLYPAITTLLAVSVLREQLRAPQWVGVVLSLGGAALLARP